MARQILVQDQITNNRGPPLYSGTEFGDSWFDVLTKLNANIAELYGSLLANEPANTLLGNNTGSPAAPAALTPTQVTAMLNVFTPSLQGLAPSSGGGTTNFLRADGNWAAPPGGSSGVRPQRPITSGAALPITAGDSILNINATSDLTPTVPSYTTRAGAPLTFKNLPGSHVQTLMATSPDTFDGATFFVLQAGASVTLVPYNDTVNTGYGIE